MQSNRTQSGSRDRSHLPIVVLWSVSIALMMSARPASAQAVDGPQDHPLVGRYEGAEIVGYHASDYDEVRIVDAPFDMVGAGSQSGAGFKTLEGRSSLEALRNHEAGLRAKGFTILFTCATSDGSCFTNERPEAAYLLGAAVGDAVSLPRLEGNYVHNWFKERGRYLLARLERSEGAVYAAIYLGESGRDVVAVVRVIETTEMETGKIVFLDAGEMQQAIAASGRVSLYGIHFDFDEATLKPDSKPTLDEIAALLTASPELKLTVVGHTDNQGTAEYNMDLSSRRAASVVAALIRDHGIAAERLSSFGAGFTAPVASNDSEEGRAKNRRVELVVQ